MKLRTKFIIAFYLLLGVTINATAKTIKLSKQKGNSVEKLKAAYNNANAGDIILIDMNVTFNDSEKHFTIKKSGLTFKGAKNNKGVKYQLSRVSKKGNIIVLTVGHTKFENLRFSTAVNLLRVEAKKQTLTNITIDNCEFLNSRYTGADFRGDFTDIRVTNCLFDDCKFGLQTMDSEILKNFIVKKSVFKRGDHQISIDNAFADTNKIEHENILIDDCEFYVAARFNIALANTRNTIISNNKRMDGGLQGYSQAIHIEHDTRDVLIKNNTMKNDIGNAIIIFSTGYTGHGNGRKIPNEEKIDFGSSNITLDGNTITSSKKAAIMIGYGRGYLKILGNNSINSEDKIIKAYETKKTMEFHIDDDVLMNGKKYNTLKNSKEIESYFFIKS